MLKEINRKLQNWHEHLEVSIQTKTEQLPTCSSTFERTLQKVAILGLQILKVVVWIVSLGHVHSISRDSIPPSSANPVEFSLLPPPNESHESSNMHSVASEVISSSSEELSLESLTALLDAWNCAHTDPANLAKAGQAILDCFRTKNTKLELNSLNLHSLPDCFRHLSHLKFLDLGANRLSTLPESISALENLEMLILIMSSVSSRPLLIPEFIRNLTNLRGLFLSMNCLSSIPDFIGNLRRLAFLDLSYNRLTSLPSTILQLPETCCLNIQGNRFSTEVLDQLQAQVNSGRGPRIEFSMPQQSNPSTVIRSIDQLVSFWASHTSHAPLIPELSSLDTQHIQSLELFLSRLAEVQSFNNYKTRSLLAMRALNFLKAFSENAEFRDICLPIVEDAVETCGDRVDYSLIQIECLWRLLQAAKTLNPIETAHMAIGMKRLQLLEDIAGEKVKTLRFVDEIEVFLAYQVYLAKPLSLPVDSHDMLYFRVSGVTAADLETAKEHVLAQTSSKQQITAFLLQSTPWLEKLEQGFEGKIKESLEEIKQEFEAKANALLESSSSTEDIAENPEWKALESERDSKLKELYQKCTEDWINENYEELIETMNPSDSFES